MGEPSNNGNSKASGSKRIKADSIVNQKVSNDECLKVHVQGRMEPLFLPFHANKSVRFKDLRAKLPGASYLALKKHSQTCICDMKNGMIEEPDVGWNGGRVWAIVNPEASGTVSDKVNLKLQKILAQLAPANRLPAHLNQIWKRFNVSSWEELYASPRFSAPYQCNMAKFLQYRNGVIQLFTPIILRQGPDGFDLFTMFRINEGDHYVCDALKELLKDSCACYCCNKDFADKLEALRHYFDLEHAFRSRKMFDEPVYVSAILETAREYGIFVPIQVFGSADNDSNVRSRKKTQPSTKSTAASSSSKASKRVKVEVVNLISPPPSPKSHSNSVVTQELPSVSTPSPVVQSVEVETPRDPSPLPPQMAPLPLQAVNRPINERQRPPVYQPGFNGYTPVMQPLPVLPVNQGYGVNPNAHTVNPPVPNANYGRNPNFIHQIPDTTLPPPSVSGFFFAPPAPGPGLSNGMPSLPQTMDPHTSLMANRLQEFQQSVPSRQRREIETAVPSAQPDHPPSRRRQDCEAGEAAHAPRIQPPKRANPRNANYEPLPSVSKRRPVPVQASPPIKKSKHIQGNANLEPISSSLAKVHIPVDPIRHSAAATPPPAKKSKCATQNVNLKPIPTSISKVPAPVEVKATPSRGKHLIFSSDESDDGDEVLPTPQSSQSVRHGWKKVMSDSSSDSEDPSVPYRSEAKKTPAPPPAKRFKVTPKSPTPPPAKKPRTTPAATPPSAKKKTAAKSAATPPSAKKKTASKPKRKSKDPPPVVDMLSDSEVSEATVPESRSGTKQPSMRPLRVPYEDFVPEYKCDLTTPIVTIFDLLQHFQVPSEAALFKLKAFRMPVRIPNFAEFIDYRKFILRNMRSFCIRQRPDFPFLFYMFKGLKTENVYLADIDRSYAMNCKRCDNSPLTLDHLFGRGHIMMFTGTRLDELQIGIDYIREQSKSATGCNSVEYNIEPFNPAYLHLLHIYKAPTIGELCLKPSFRSSLLPMEEVNRFRAEIIHAIVNTQSPRLPFIVLLTFSIDKLIYLRDHLASNLPLQVRCDQEGTLQCRCGKTLEGHPYVVHVLKENHLNESAFETLKNVMDDMFPIQDYGPPTIGYTTIEDLSRCPYHELTRILRCLRRNKDRNGAKAVDDHLNGQITAIEAELIRRGCSKP
uniref:C2H2-type domain-containing protein n=1 Tax=Panagrellus redivivus TaxID=6233 RepID=A0A7E4UQE5_PANRE